MKLLRRLWNFLTLRQPEPSVRSWQRARADMKEMKPHRRWGQPTRWVRVISSHVGI